MGTFLAEGTHTGIKGIKFLLLDIKGFSTEWVAQCSRRDNEQVDPTGPAEGVGCLEGIIQPFALEPVSNLRACANASFSARLTLGSEGNGINLRIFVLRSDTRSVPRISTSSSKL